MSNSEDRIEIEVLPDGRIKATTDQVSMPNHASAEGFLKLMAELVGGKQERVRRGHSHGHSHSHSHSHDGHHHHAHDHDGHHHHEGH